MLKRCFPFFLAIVNKMHKRFKVNLNFRVHQTSTDPDSLIFIKDFSVSGNIAQLHLLHIVLAQPHDSVFVTG